MVAAVLQVNPPPFFGHESKKIKIIFQGCCVFFCKGDHAQWLGMEKICWPPQYFVLHLTHILNKYESHFETIKMGNKTSSTPILPLAFGDCFVKLQLDIKKFQLYLLGKKKREETHYFQFIFQCG